MAKTLIELLFDSQGRLERTIELYPPIIPVCESFNTAFTGIPCHVKDNVAVHDFANLLNSITRKVNTLFAESKAPEMSDDDLINLRLKKLNGDLETDAEFAGLFSQLGGLFAVETLGDDKVKIIIDTIKRCIIRADLPSAVMGRENAPKAPTPPPIEIELTDLSQPKPSTVTTTAPTPPESPRIEAARSQLITSPRPRPLTPRKSTSSPATRSSTTETTPKEPTTAELESIFNKFKEPGGPLFGDGNTELRELVFSEIFSGFAKAALKRKKSEEITSRSRETTFVGQVKKAFNNASKRFSEFIGLSTESAQVKSPFDQVKEATTLKDIKNALNKNLGIDLLDTVLADKASPEQKSAFEAENKLNNQIACRILVENLLRKKVIELSNIKDKNFKNNAQMKVFLETHREQIITCYSASESESDIQARFKELIKAISTVDGNGECFIKAHKELEREYLAIRKTSETLITPAPAQDSKPVESAGAPRFMKPLMEIYTTEQSFFKGMEDFTAQKRLEAGFADFVSKQPEADRESYQFIFQYLSTPFDQIGQTKNPLLNIDFSNPDQLTIDVLIGKLNSSDFMATLDAYENAAKSYLSLEYFFTDLRETFGKSYSIDKYFITAAGGLPTASAYTITPLQRLMRYPLLLEEIKKRAPDGTSEFKNISAQLDAAKKRAAATNNWGRSAPKRIACDRFHEYIIEQLKKSGASIPAITDEGYGSLVALYQANDLDPKFKKHIELYLLNVFKLKKTDKLLQEVQQQLRTESSIQQYIDPAIPAVHTTDLLPQLDKFYREYVLKTQAELKLPDTIKIPRKTLLEYYFNLTSVTSDPATKKEHGAALLELQKSIELYFKGVFGTNDIGQIEVIIKGKELAQLIDPKNPHPEDFEKVSQFYHLVIKNMQKGRLIPPPRKSRVFQEIDLVDLYEDLRNKEAEQEKDTGLDSNKKLPYSMYKNYVGEFLQDIYGKTKTKDLRRAIETGQAKRLKEKQESLTNMLIASLGDIFESLHPDRRPSTKEEFLKRIQNQLPTLKQIAAHSIQDAHARGITHEDAITTQYKQVILRTLKSSYEDPGFAISISQKEGLDQAKIQKLILELAPSKQPEVKERKIYESAGPTTIGRQGDKDMFRLSKSKEYEKMTALEKEVTKKLLSKLGLMIVTKKTSLDIEQQPLSDDAAQIVRILWENRTVLQTLAKNKSSNEICNRLIDACKTYSKSSLTKNSDKQAAERLYHLLYESAAGGQLHKKKPKTEAMEEKLNQFLNNQWAPVLSLVLKKLQAAESKTGETIVASTPRPSRPSVILPPRTEPMELIAQFLEKIPRDEKLGDKSWKPISDYVFEFLKPQETDLSPEDREALPQTLKTLRERADHFAKQFTTPTDIRKDPDAQQFVVATYMLKDPATRSRLLTKPLEAIRKEYDKARDNLSKAIEVFVEAFSLSEQAKEKLKASLGKLTLSPSFTNAAANKLYYMAQTGTFASLIVPPNRSELFKKRFTAVNEVLQSAFDDANKERRLTIERLYEGAMKKLIDSAMKIYPELDTHGVSYEEFELVAHPMIFKLDPKQKQALIDSPEIAELTDPATLTFDSSSPLKSKEADIKQFYANVKTFIDLRKALGENAIKAAQEKGVTLTSADIQLINKKAGEAAAAIVMKNADAAKAFLTSLKAATDTTSYEALKTFASTHPEMAATVSAFTKGVTDTTNKAGKSKPSIDTRGTADSITISPPISVVVTSPEETERLRKADEEKAREEAVMARVRAEEAERERLGKAAEEKAREKIEQPRTTAAGTAEIVVPGTEKKREEEAKEKELAVQSLRAAIGTVIDGHIAKAKKDGIELKKADFSEFQESKIESYIDAWTKSMPSDNVKALVGILNNNRHEKPGFDSHTMDPVVYATAEIVYDLVGKPIADVVAKKKTEKEAEDQKAATAARAAEAKAKADEKARIARENEGANKKLEAKLGQLCKKIAGDHADTIEKRNVFATASKACIEALDSLTPNEKQGLEDQLDQLSNAGDPKAAVGAMEDSPVKYALQTFVKTIADATQAAEEAAKTAAKEREKTNQAELAALAAKEKADIATISQGLMSIERHLDSAHRLFKTWGPLQQYRAYYEVAGYKAKMENALGALRSAIDSRGNGGSTQEEQSQTSRLVVLIDNAKRVAEIMEKKFNIKKFEGNLPDLAISSFTEEKPVVVEIENGSWQQTYYKHRGDKAEPPKKEDDFPALRLKRPDSEEGFSHWTKDIGPNRIRINTLHVAPKGNDGKYPSDSECQFVDRYDGESHQFVSEVVKLPQEMSSFHILANALATDASKHWILGTPLAVKFGLVNSADPNNTDALAAFSDALKKYLEEHRGLKTHKPFFGSSGLEESINGFLDYARTAAYTTDDDLRRKLKLDDAGIAAWKKAIQDKDDRRDLVSALERHYEKTVKSPDYQDKLRAIALTTVNDYLAVARDNSEPLYISKAWSPDIVRHIMIVCSLKNSYATSEAEKITVVNATGYSGKGLTLEEVTDNQRKELRDKIKTAAKDDKHPLHHLYKRQYELLSPRERAAAEEYKKLTPEQKQHAEKVSPETFFQPKMGPLTQRKKAADESLDGLNHSIERKRTGMKGG